MFGRLKPAVSVWSPGFPQIGFLKNIITGPNIEIGDCTYYDDPDGVRHFEDNVLYHRRRQSRTCRPGAFRCRYRATAIGNRLVGPPGRMDRPAPRPDPRRGR